jgi:hypothetical protein
MRQVFPLPGLEVDLNSLSEFGKLIQGLPIDAIELKECLLFCLGCSLSNSLFFFKILILGKCLYK